MRMDDLDRKFLFVAGALLCGLGTWISLAVLGHVMFGDAGSITVALSGPVFIGWMMMRWARR